MELRARLVPALRGYRRVAADACHYPNSFHEGQLMTKTAARSLIGKGIEGFMTFVTFYIIGFCTVITLAWGAISLLSWAIFG